jgi:hypothetical protein
VRDAAHFETLMSRRFDEGGPVLLAAKIDDTSGTAQTPARPRPHPSAFHARDRHRAAKRARRLRVIAGGIGIRRGDKLSVLPSPLWGGGRARTRKHVPK